MSTTPTPPERRMDRVRAQRALRASREKSVEPGEAFDELRRLLVAPEQERLAKVEERLAVDELGRVLPEAATSSQKESGDLARALSPAMVSAIRDAVENQPRLFVDAIVPVIGPAIRKSVTTALRSLIQQLNETLARGLSLRALRWRWEAARTGRPFAEVVLLRSLLYRVEQVFLVHRESGLVLRHLMAPESPKQDPDQIAAMLTAIDDFVHDAFREDARLGRFQVGELTGWVEHGPMAVLVAVVRGTAPDSYANVLREAQEEIHLRFRSQLSHFDGDTEVFASADEILEGCLRTESAPDRSPGARRLRPYAAKVCVGLAVLACVLLGISTHRHQVDQERFSSLVARLRSEPGLVITRAEDHHGHYTLEGLSDPLSPSPREILDRAGMDSSRADLRFLPFYSLDPRIVERRAAQLLNPPVDVTLTFDDGVLVAHGTASRRWIDSATFLAPSLPGVTRFDTSRLTDEGESSGY